MKELNGRVAVVTGAASGIGRGLAVRFAEEGMKVVLADVEDGPLEEAVAEIVGTGGTAIGVRTDVTDPDQIQALADRTMQEFGAVHVLCNNAGVESGGVFEEIPLRAWQWVVDVNLYGVINGCRIFLPLIRQSGEGHIVNTGSLASFAAEAPTFHPYVTTKFAVLGLSESLEGELRRNGDAIHVSLLGPGIVKSNMTQAERNRPADVPDTRERPERAAVLGFLDRATAEAGMEPSEVAGLVVEAIRAERFFVLTHPDQAIGAVRARLDWMTTGEPPVDPAAQIDVGQA